MSTVGVSKLLMVLYITCCREMQRKLTLGMTGSPQIPPRIQATCKPHAHRAGDYGESGGGRLALIWKRKPDGINACLLTIPLWRMS